MAKKVGPDSKMEVRRLQVEEWSQYREMRLRSLKEDPLAFGSTLASQSGLPDDYWQARAFKLANSDSQAMWVAVSQEGHLTGLVVVALEALTYHLYSMWLSQEYRGLGVGGRLLDTALQWARERHPGLPFLLDVNPKQLAAVRLYESRGFRPTGKSEPLGHTDGEVTVEMVLRK